MTVSTTTDGFDPLDYPQEEADRVFDILGTLCVELDDDPLPYGPKRLNSKTAQIRRMLDRCEKLFLDISRRLQTTRRALRIGVADLDLAKKNLFANDPETRAGRSVSDREAIAAGKLAQEIQIVRNLTVATEDLDAVMTVIKAKRADLKDTEGRLRDQMRLCSEEIGLGGRWGSRVHDAPDLNGKAARYVATGQDIADLDVILGNVDGEIKLSRDAGTWEDPEEFAGSPQTSTSETEEEVEEIAEIPAVSVNSQVTLEAPLEPDSLGDLTIDSGDVSLDLPGTTTLDQVDEFLEGAVISSFVPRAKPNLAQIVDDIDMDAILGMFEDFR